MANRIKTGDPRGFNKGRSSKFHEGTRVRKHLKKSGGNIGRNVVDKDEDNSLKTLYDKNYQASSQKFRQLIFDRNTWKHITLQTKANTTLNGNGYLCWIILES